MFQFKAKVTERSSQRESGRRNSLLFLGGSAFLSYSGFQLIGWSPSTLGRAFCFTHFAYSNVNIIQKYSHRHTQNNVWLDIWVPYSPVKLTHKIKINHHTGKLCKLRKKRQMRSTKRSGLLSSQNLEARTPLHPPLLFWEASKRVKWLPLLTSCNEGEDDPPRAEHSFLTWNSGLKGIIKVLCGCSPVRAETP